MLVFVKLGHFNPPVHLSPYLHSLDICRWAKKHKMMCLVTAWKIMENFRGNEQLGLFGSDNLEFLREGRLWKIYDRSCGRAGLWLLSRFFYKKKLRREKRAISTARACTVCMIFFVKSSITPPLPPSNFNVYWGCTAYNTEHIVNYAFGIVIEVVCACVLFVSLELCHPGSVACIYHAAVSRNFVR